MIRNKRYISGRSTRHFNYRTGVVQDKRSVLVTFFLPLFMMMGILAGGSYAGYNYYQNTPSILANEDSDTSNQPKDTEDSPYELKAFQAREDEFLASQIKSKISDISGGSEWSVTVRDLNSGRMANVNADQKLNPAGLYKMFLLPSLEKRLSSDYWQSYIDYRYSVEECVARMIKSDDDSCVTAFGYYLGWDKYNEYNQVLGFKETSIKQDGSISTSREVGEMMYRLQNSQILSDKARRLAFDSLYDQEKIDGIPKGCGQDCLVANLASEYEGYKHDVAVVTHGQAKYVVTIMTNNASWSDIAEMASYIDKEMFP